MSSRKMAKAMKANPTSDAEIARAVADDPDTFIPDREWFKHAKIVMPKPKEAVTLRLDPDVLTYFRKAGRGYQTRINAVLKAFVESRARRAG